MAADTARRTDDLEDRSITDTEWRVVQWMRLHSGPLYVAALTDRQKRALDAFVLSMRESSTLH